ncbi:PREDICTED: TMV resistance protein N-like [Ipomoea nil]|uniref:TMV resistance protein N-like n=1 Tax=Ipomoea nil TaxID=35883 RepID=UPI0009009F70|nr:PREDICTED: TMV resistance protein N-like [Ipomoea nil]
MESTSETNQLLLLPSSSSSLPRCWDYDVFLSFRGEDTRKSFTDHLFAALCRAGVHTFRDAEELRKGEDISTDLIKAIQESKISIIVFSKTYASSRWCLEELVKIVECKEKVNQVVFPVFYDVDPSEVRKQTGGFGDALAQHQQQFGTKKLSQWKTALTKVANFCGWDLQNDVDGYESKFIDKIVEKVLHVVNRTFFNVAKYPVGIHTRVREIFSSLQSKSNGDVCMIGKTTLAKAIFNQIYETFEGSCFLDVRSECSKGESVGLKCLQEQLLCKTLKTMRFEVNHVDEGISLIKLRLGLKKVLIVVDGVEHESQLEALVGDGDWFGSGSTILITTRNVNLLNGLGKDCEKYNVVVLSSKESLQLFCWHAFKDPNPLEAFAELSNVIVSYAGGLPLALTVLGSHFRSRSSIQHWRADFEKLRKIPHEDILNILKMSYDALDDDTQRIFLDIACFFEGGYIHKEEIVMILNACGFFAQSGIATLINRCLLREKDYYMHDLVRDMGREIVRQESLMVSEKRSRLFLCDEVLDVLVNNKGNEDIETMIIDLPKEVHLSTKVFSKMSRLRLLRIESMNAKGSLKYLSNELRLLFWNHCPLRHISSDLCLKKLVILEITDSNIKEFKPNLQQLKGSPNFTGAHNLKTLSFFNCPKLVELSQSIGDLESLVELDMRFCENLRALPNSICNLKSLKCLDLEFCSKIKKLPTNLGKLEQLRVLNAKWTSVSHVPFSCGSLRYLYYLTLGQSNYTDGYDYRSVEPISSYANLCSLETLQAPYQFMQHLDLQMGSLSLLTFLDLSNSYFTTIPFNLSHLSQLKDLVLNKCQNLQLIKDLPPNLGRLVAYRCPLLENIQDVSGLYRLSLSIYKSLIIEPRCSFEKLCRLDLCDSYLDTLPFKLSHLSQLRSLCLYNCQNLRVIQDLPYSSLMHLRIHNCSNLIEIQGIENCVNLRSISMLYCSALASNSCGAKLFKVVHTRRNKVLEWRVYDHFIEANKVEEVKVVVEFYSSLEQGAEENLRIETCIVYEKEGEVCFFPVNPNKVIIFRPDDDSAHTQRDVYPRVNITLTISSPTSDSKMEMQLLDLSYSDFDALPFTLCHLSKLKYLDLNNCLNLQVIKDLPLSLSEFSAENCPLLRSVPDLSSLLSLEVLYLGNCCKLIELVGVENLVNLKTMDITGLPSRDNTNDYGWGYLGDPKASAVTRQEIPLKPSAWNLSPMILIPVVVDEGGNYEHSWTTTKGASL